MLSDPTVDVDQEEKDRAVEEVSDGLTDVSVTITCMRRRQDSATEMRFQSRHKKAARSRCFASFRSLGGNCSRKGRMGFQLKQSVLATFRLVLTPKRLVR